MFPSAFLFCTHCNLLKTINWNLDEGSQALQEFLQSRNPRQQHSSTLESYLIKPIQRILKYPLLLQQLRNLTDANSSEHQHLVGRCLNDAIKSWFDFDVNRFVQLGFDWRNRCPERHGKSGWAYQRDAADPRRVWRHLWSSFPPASEIVQTTSRP